MTIENDSLEGDLVEGVLQESEKILTFNTHIEPPPPSISFWAPPHWNVEVGRLWVDETGFHFRGDADESALRLFEGMKQALDEYLEYRKKAEEGERGNE